MADNSNTILNQLQDFSIPAPENAFNNAWAAICTAAENAVSTTAAAHIFPVSENINTVNNEALVFSKLQDYVSPDMQPPAFNFEVIKKAPENNFQEKPQKKAAIFTPFFYKAAAAVVVVAAGTTIYYSLNNKPNITSNSSFASELSKPKENTAVSPLKTDSIDSGIKKEVAITPATTANKTKLTTTNKRKSFLSGKNSVATRDKKRTKKAFKVKRNNYELADNDVMLTLVNYQLLGKDELFTKAIAEKRITLNEYSYLNLSDKMVDLLQNMYVTKGNGKPSRKAKKTKAKFEKWKKEDEKYFDKDLQKNPVDIIDLSEFIF